MYRVCAFCESVPRFAPDSAPRISGRCKSPRLRAHRDPATPERVLAVIEKTALTWKFRPCVQILDRPERVRDHAEKTCGTTGFASLLRRVRPFHGVVVELWV